MTGERDNVRLDEWLAQQSKHTDEQIERLILYAGRLDEHAYNALLRDALIDTMQSYSVLLSALSQHPNIRNLP